MGHLEILSQDEVISNAHAFITELEGDLQQHQCFSKIRQIYDVFGDIWPVAPASGNEYFHNSFIGGYVDHIRNVVRYTKALYQFYVQNGMDVSGFTYLELLMVAYHHDLGKLGYPTEDGEVYVVETSEWHVNQGNNYRKNEKLPFMLIQDRSLFILQKFGITLTENEFLSIKIHDGLYDEVNIPYYKSSKHYSRLRTKLPYIVHQADLMASQFEFDRMATFKQRKFTSIEWNI